jgi:hypothetical protein
VVPRPGREIITPCQNASCKIALSKTSVSTTFDYHEHASPFPILKRWAERSKVKSSSGGLEELESTHTFDLVEGDVPEKEFTLTAFGLSEPSGVKRPVRWYLWAGMAGMGCVALALLLWWVRRRKTTSVAAQ